MSFLTEEEVFMYTTYEIYQKVFNKGEIADELVSKEKKLRAKIINILRFNIFCEESQGYSKVLTDLHYNQTQSENIFLLINRFDLDPNRILDIILNFMEKNLEKQETLEYYFKLIEKFNIKNIPHLLGFKFKKVKEQKDLVQLTALLIYRKLITLSDIYSHVRKQFLI